MTLTDLRLPSFEDVRLAAKRIAGMAHRTPVLTSRTADAATGAKLRSGSYGSFVYRDAVIVCVERSVKSSVCPSGAAFATTSAPIVVPAPGRFSTRTCWPRLCVSSAASARENVSVAPPGANGTTMRTGFEG